MKVSELEGRCPVSDLRVALHDTLGPRYRIEREVRPVGECRLFVARPTPAGPDLLVKVLPGPLSLAVDADAFARELLLLADRVGKPHIVVPRGAGRAAAHVYHTRPFVMGTTLRAALLRHGALPLTRAAAIVREVLHALAALHDVPVAHGDLRPENVLLADKKVLLADAGIVATLERCAESAPAAVSAAVCAAPYVAPERHVNEAPIEPRDDMFAVGVLLHEMLTGRPPAPEPEPLGEARSLPAWVDALMGRCLATDVSQRWPNAREAYESIPSET